MTDEERHRLCANLRADAFALTPSFAGHNRMAADEIERLADMTTRYKILSKFLCTIIREKLIELEGIEND